MRSNELNRPGFMIYFDSIRPALDLLSDEQLGKLFRAIVDYTEHGVFTELDPVCSLAFGMLKPSLDNDRERYADKVYKSRYANYVKDQKRKGEQYTDYEEWLSSSPPLHPSASPCETVSDSDVSIDIDSSFDFAIGTGIDTDIGNRPVPSGSIRSEEETEDQRRERFLGMLEDRKR